MGVRIRMAQLNLLVGDVAGNVRQVIATARQARADGVDLVLFPELTLTGYPPEDLLLRPECLRRVDDGLERIAAAVPEVALVLGYPRASVGGLFNVAGLLRGGRIEVEYAKQALPNYSVFDEKRYFQPGATPAVFELGGVRVGLSICEDIWREEPSRQAAAAGAQLLLNLNASPFHAGKAAEREALVGQRAATTGMSVLYANLVGGQDELVFDGGSFAVDASGRVVARARACVEDRLTLDLADPAHPLAVDGSALIPLEDEVAGIYRVLTLGVRDYVGKNGFQGAILGLSGGIDSALTLALAADALGPERVEAVLMPSRYTSDMSNEDALEQARRMGVQAHAIPIEPAFAAFREMLRPVFAATPTPPAAGDVTEENIQARCRGMLLMALSNRSGRILLTTGNKSEMAVGYATLYGDMAGGFAPIKDVPKLLVYALARHRNRLAPVIPERVLTRAPSAELRPDQTDQDSLPPYEVLDPILKRYIEDDEDVASIAARGFPEDLVRRVARLVDRNEYKRRQAPPGVRISRRAFGRDRRYPMTSGF